MGEGRTPQRPPWAFCLLWLVLAPVGAAFAQTKDGPIPFAHELVHYYNEAPRVDLALALDELAVLPGPGSVLDLRSLRSADATVTAIEAGGAHLRYYAASRNRSSHEERARGLAGPGRRVLPVLYLTTARDRASDERRILTRRLSLKLREGTDLDALLRQHNLALAETVAFSPNTYILEARDDLTTAALDAANAIYEAGGVEFATPLIRRWRSTRFIPNDPNFPQQWHLRNVGQVSGAVAGADVNIVNAWDSFAGAGVNITIVDTGVAVGHPDLSANARTDIDIDLVDNDGDPTPLFSDHGTSVAGIAAAVGNNGVAVTGAAFEASIIGVRLLETPTTDLLEATAMGHQAVGGNPSDRTHINSNSWGPLDDGFRLETMGPLTLAAIENAINNGRGGLGTIYVWAGGNGRNFGDNVNYDGYASSRYTIAVGASGGDGVFSSYSEAGASLLVNAPSSYGSVGTTTTTGAAGVTSGFGGTSSAAPLAAGVIALMLEQNPGLNWRDVQHILVRTSTQNDPSDPGWFVNGGGHLFNHTYGFGRIDAGAALDLGATWTGIAPLLPPVTDSISKPMAIPDDSLGGVIQGLSFSGNPGFTVEHVEVTVNISHTFRGDLRIKLISPSATESILADIHSDPTDDYNNWMFTTVAHWGESVDGTWLLHVSDLATADVGTLLDWSVTAYGYLGVASDISSLRVPFFEGDSTAR